MAKINIGKYKFKTEDPFFLKKRFRDQAESMLKEYDQIKRDRKLINRTDEGASIENIVKAFLNDNLPQKYGVEKGYVMNSKGEISNEQDIVIFDRLNGIILKDTGGVKFFPVESVYATIEVKSNLSKTKLREAIDNVKSVKALLKTTILFDENTGKIHAVRSSGKSIFSSVFAFNSGVQLKTVGNNLKASGGVDYICILDCGIICYSVWVKATGEKVGELACTTITSSPDYSKDKVTLLSADGQEKSAEHFGQYLFWFFTQLLEHLEKEANKGIDTPLPQYMELNRNDNFKIKFL